MKLQSDGSFILTAEERVTLLAEVQSLGNKLELMRQGAIVLSQDLASSMQLAFRWEQLCVQNNISLDIVRTLVLAREEGKLSEESFFSSLKGLFVNAPESENADEITQKISPGILEMLRENPNAI